MEWFRIPRAFTIALFLIPALLLGWAVYTLSFRSALEQMAQQGNADLALAADRLTGELERYRELSVLMADHPLASDVLFAGSATVQDQDRLRDVADKTGALDLLVIARSGAELASASATPSPTH